MTEAPMVLVETEGRVGLVRLNRPQALNALCDQLMAELGAALRRLDADPAIGAIVLTGDARAFAAGADIKEMKERRFPATALADFIAPWEAVTEIGKPVIAAVAGFALGGGCELAMMCDMVIAASDAKFGQPEIKLGILPGAGGTQRLARAVGKAKAMDLVLTGRFMDAAEAERSGLVARVVEPAALLGEAMAVAAGLAALSPVALAQAKRAVNAAFETPLREGVRFERQLFLALFGTPDQIEGMTAFAEKRPPRFSPAPAAAGEAGAAAGR